MPKQAIRKGIVITLKILRVSVSFSRKPRSTPSTTFLSPLKNVSDAKFATKPYAAGCSVPDSRIKKTLTYAEGDEKAQKRFIRQIERLKKRLGEERILYMDEAGMLAGDVYHWGWSEKGKRKYGQRTGKKRGRVNFMAAIGKQGPLIEPLIFEGACHRDVVESWLEMLVERLPQDERGEKLPHVLVMDNATFHKGGRIKEILWKARCLLVYLPPYSPQLNPIERCWSAIKCKAGQWLSQGMDLYRAVERALVEYET